MDARLEYSGPGCASTGCFSHRPLTQSLLCDNTVSLGEQCQAKALDGYGGIQGRAHGAKVWGGRAPGEAGLETACYRPPPLQGTGRRAGVKLGGQEDGRGQRAPGFLM